MAGLTAEQAKSWMDSNPDKAGTPAFVTVKQAYDALSAAPAPTASAPTPAAAGPAGSTALPPISVDEPGTPSPPISGPDNEITVNPIDYEAPIADVRGKIGALPEQQRGGAWNQWGDVQEQLRMKNLGPVGKVANTFDEGIRILTQGVPGGSFLDEMNAGTKALLPEAWGGMPYTEAKAMEDARDRRLRAEIPYSNAAGNVIGAIGTAPLTALKGAGVAANMGLDTLLGLIHGIGDGEGGLKDRLNSGLKEAGATFAMSYPMRSLGAFYNKHSAVNDAVAKAAEQLGIKLPFFARAESPAVQAAGRQAAQRAPESSLGQSWTQADDATRRAASDTGERVLGAPADTAPYVAGQHVTRGMERSVEGIGDQMGQLANETTQLMPTGAIFNMPATRQSLGNIVEERLASRMQNPQAGLQDTYNATNQPITWEGASRYVSDLGESLRGPPRADSTLARQDASRLYAPARDVDQPAMVNQVLGPAGEARFRTNVDSQRELADLRRTLNTTMGTRGPEQLVSLAHTAATVKGGGTRINQLQAMTQGMTAEERQALGAGVIAKIQNDTGGSPMSVAQKLRDIPDMAKDILFPQGTRLRADIDALGPLTQRVGAVDRMQHVGSAKTTDFLKMGGTGAGTLGAGYLANKFNVGTEFASLVAALAAAKAGKSKVMPTILQHGLPASLQSSVDATTGGLARGFGQQW